MQRHAAQAGLERVRCQRPRFGGHEAVELRADEADVGRRGEQRALRVLGDDLDARRRRRGGRSGRGGSSRPAAPPSAVNARPSGTVPSSRGIVLGAPRREVDPRDRGSKDSTSQSQRPSGGDREPVREARRVARQQSHGAVRREADERPSSRPRNPSRSDVERPVGPERRVVRRSVRPSATGGRPPS